jgi:hypothetical protein
MSEQIKQRRCHLVHFLPRMMCRNFKVHFANLSRNIMCDNHLPSSQWLLVRLKIVLVLLALTPSITTAQTGSGWSNQGLLYLLGPTLDGATGVGDLETEVDLGMSDVFDAIDKGFLGMYRGEGERWGMLVDVVYMDLKMGAEGSRGVLSGELELEQTLAIASATWRLNDSLRLMGGAMYADLSTDIALTGPQTARMASIGEDWVDPLVGVLFETPVGAGWEFAGSAQIGGFGVGSDLVVILSGAMFYRFNDWSSLSLGYRYLDFDYEDGDGADRFTFDMKQHGPLIGFRFDF